MLKKLQGDDAQKELGSNSSSKQCVVVDTSIIISAIFWNGPEREILLHITQNHNLVLSDYIISELMQFCNKTAPKLSQQARREVKNALEIYVRDSDAPDNISLIRDINDEPIIRLALRYKAIIVTGDNDILAYPDAKPPTLTTAEYMELFIDNKP